MEEHNGVYEWVTLKTEKPIPPVVIPGPVFEEIMVKSHKQNELGDENNDDDD